MERSEARSAMDEGDAEREPAEDIEIHTTDESVQTTDETVQTTSETVETDATILAPDIVTVESAGRLLAEEFGPLVDADYLPGKTLLCDTLAAHFGVSVLTAEELCDELERAERIRFVRTDDGAAWHIHDDLDAA
ncbi:Hypothetical protein A7982_00287 [Minicystis rosea]|nr:Hypothetical protein A7982_00287 [Minicystis rosea]